MTGYTPKIISDPKRYSSIREDTISEHAVRHADPTECIPFLAITANVVATAARQGSVEILYEVEA